jgi:hypothetical protein
MQRKTMGRGGLVALGALGIGVTLTLAACTDSAGIDEPSPPTPVHDGGHVDDFDGGKEQKDGGKGADANGDGGGDASTEGGGDGGAPNVTGLCTKDGWCWTNPLPQGDVLRGVWPSSGSDVLFAGSGIPLHFDGATFTRANGTNSAGGRLWGTSASNVWAPASIRVFGGAPAPAVAHWNGAAWSDVALPSGNYARIAGVWGSGASDVVAAGDESIYRYDGATWSLVHKDPGVVDAVDGVLSAIYQAAGGTGPNDVWVVGAPDIVTHWDGASWTTTRTGLTNNYLRSIYAFSKTDVWVVGDYTPSLGAPIVAHWDGMSWTQATTPLKYGASAVWGAAPNDVWVVTESGEIAHYNGAAWSAVTSPTTEPLIEVRGRTASDVWAVGASGTMLHWDGAAWSDLRKGLHGFFRAVWSNKKGDTWAVGNEADGFEGLIVHWDGATWKKAAIPQGTEDFRAVFGFGTNDVWAAADIGGTLHFDGNAWTSKGSPGGFGAVSLWGAAPNDLWAVGDLNLTSHWDGNTWTEVANPLTGRHELHAVFGFASNDVWAVGDDFIEDVALHWDGNAWTQVAMPPPFGGFANYRPSALWGAASNDLWATGLSGTLHWNGAAWSVDATKLSGESIFGVSASEIYVGARRFDDLSKSTEVGESLMGLHGAGNELWGVGAYGALLRKTH